MPLTTVLLTIVAAGVLLWLVNRFIPMQDKSIDPEWPGRRRPGLVDCESLRIVSTPQSIPRREVTDHCHRNLQRFARQPKLTMQYSSPLTAGDIVKHTLLFVIGSALSMSAFAQAGPQQPIGSTPTYVVSETSRTVEAVDYQHRSGGLRSGSGRNRFAALSRWQSQSAQQARHDGSEANFGNCKAPRPLAPEYLTYVMWAISPEVMQ